MRERDEEPMLELRKVRHRPLLLLVGLPEDRASSLALQFCQTDQSSDGQVWHVHRLFCGPGKANPWRWPYLWPEEVEAAIDSLDKVANPKTDSQTLADRLLVLFTTPRDNLPVSSSLLHEEARC